MGLENILTNPVAHRVGWALVHFVWQGTAVAMLLACAMWLLRRRSANIRYAVACAVLVLMLVLVAGTIWLAGGAPSQPPTITANTQEAAPGPVLPQEEKPIIEDTVAEQPPPFVARLAEPPPHAHSTLPDAPAAAPAARAEPPAPAQPTAGAAEPELRSWYQQGSEVVSPYLPWVVCAYLAGVLCLSLWHLGGWRQVHRLRRLRTQPAGAPVEQMIARLKSRLGVGRTVGALRSALVGVPTVVGWLRPVILLPAAAVTGLTAEQLEAILAHELAHIRRFDYLVNLLQTAAETLLFYHPAVWWVSRRIRAERENCCDDLAVGECSQPLAYARALAAVARLSIPRPKLAVAADGGKLLARVRRLVGLPAGRGDRRLAWLAGALTFLGVAAIVIGLSVSCAGDKAAADDDKAAVNARPAIEPPSAPAKVNDTRRVEIAKAVAAAIEKAVQEHSDKTKIVSLEGHGYPRGLEGVWSLTLRDWPGKNLNRSAAMEKLVSEVRALTAAGREDEVAVYCAAAGEFLAHEEAPYRAVACEFLAHFPGQTCDCGLLPRVGELLTDQRAAFDALLFSYSPEEGGHWGLRQSGSMAVAEVARTALELTTGLPFKDRAAFARWLEANENPREHLWYWAGRWRNRPGQADREIGELEKLPGETALKIMLLAPLPDALQAEADLALGGAEPQDKLKVTGLSVAFPSDENVAKFLIRHSLKGTAIAMLSRSPDWPELKEPSVRRSLLSRLISVLRPAVTKDDVDKLLKVLEVEDGPLANVEVTSPWAPQPRQELAAMAAWADKSRTEQILLSQLEKNPAQSRLACGLLYSTRLKHWELVKKTYRQSEIPHRFDVIRSVVELAGWGHISNAEAKKALGELLAWEDLAATAAEPRWQKAGLMSEFWHAADKLNAGKPIVSEELTESARTISLSPEAGRGLTADEEAHNAAVPAARAEIIKRLEEFFDVATAA